MDYSEEPDSFCKNCDALAKLVDRLKEQLAALRSAATPFRSCTCNGPCTPAQCAGAKLRSVLDKVKT